MHRLPAPLATLVAFLGLPALAPLSSGIVRLEPCVPGSATLLDPHLLVLSAAPHCASGVALDGGAIALVCTVTLVGLFAWTLGAAALAGTGVVARRCSCTVEHLGRLQGLASWRRAGALLAGLARLLASSERRRRGAEPTAVPGGWRPAVVAHDVWRRGPPALV